MTPDYASLKRLFGKGLATQISSDFFWMADRFAQISVHVPAGNIISEYHGTPSYYSVNGLNVGENENCELTSELAQLFEEYGTEDENDIVIFYFPKLLPITMHGKSFPRLCGFSGKQVNNIVIGRQDTDRITLSHEMLHIIRNSSHLPGMPCRFIFSAGAWENFTDEDPIYKRRLLPDGNEHGTDDEQCFIESGFLL